MKHVASFWAFLVLLLSIVLVSAPLVEAAPPSNFQSTLVAGSGLNGPAGFKFAPDGRIFILERAGKVKIYKNGQVLATPFVDLPSAASGDRGLIGITFDPDFNTNHYVYFWYTSSGDFLNKLVRFNASGDVATDGPVILYQTQAPSQELHVGGALDFGADGKIYIGIGDNGYSANAQNMAVPFGKIMRINKDGSIPADNPYVGQPGILPEIWANGLRNPWRGQIDPETGRFYISDVGDYPRWELWMACC
jgi:glucose/arabinose dehydrogenase